MRLLALFALALAGCEVASAAPRAHIARVAEVAFDASPMPSPSPSAAPTSVPSSSPSPTALAPLPFCGTEFTLGDSISNNPNVPSGSPKWTDMLAAADPCEQFTNLAVPGVTTAYILNTEEPLVPRYCSLITLDAGANDYDKTPGNETAWATYTLELRQLIDKLHGDCPTAPIALMTYVNDYLPSDQRYGWFNRMNAYIRAIPPTRAYVVLVDIAADQRFAPYPGSPYMFNVLHENGPGQEPMAEDFDSALTAATTSLRKSGASFLRSVR